VSTAHTQEGSAITDPYGLVTCTVPRCTAWFFLIEARGAYAQLCIDHASEARRERDGWTPENSVD
jgi:hypothetical protein